MIEVPLSRINAVGGARSGPELRVHLQEVLEFEYIVIPPYLTALFSLRQGMNTAIREALHGVVVDEMLHVALIANVLNAIGCPPVFSAQRLVRSYPARLPLGARGVELGLQKFSLDLVRRVFLGFDRSRARRMAGLSAAGGPFGTVGDFYDAIARRLGDLGDRLFVGDPALQFVDAVSYSERDLFAVSDAATAARALRRIVGVSDAADVRNSESRRHLEQLALGHADFNPLDAAGIIDIVENSRASMYPPASPARAAVDEFNRVYSGMLVDLQSAFSGRPERYQAAVSSMYGLTGLARSIVAIERDDGTSAAPSFELCE